jgi:DNA replication and repair protein RecF
VRLDRLHLRDFRNYETAEVAFAPGLTALLGQNGQGKTNLLEAVAYLATLRSFRSAAGDVLVRSGAERAVVRAEGCRDGREVLIEAEVARTGRHRAQLNRQRLTKAADLVGVATVTVFTPEHLALVKEGPQLRRDLLDDGLVALDARFDGVRRELERVLRQRNALLKQVGGGAPLSTEAALTLSVWDDKLSTIGERVRAARVGLVERLAPLVARAYHQLARAEPPVGLVYRGSFAEGELATALEAARRDELRRAVTLVGPHRDDLEITLSGQSTRTHASQGEQRTMALALKLAVHRLVTETIGEPPILLLDDVFSELDPDRAAALVAHLPAGQAVLTSADRLPSGAVPERVYRVAAGTVEQL